MKLLVRAALLLLLGNIPWEGYAQRIRNPSFEGTPQPNAPPPPGRPVKRSAPPTRSPRWGVRKAAPTAQTRGQLLLSFHLGDDERRRVEDFWYSGKSLDFYFFRPDTIREKLTQNGFRVKEVRLRDPYAGVEYECQRAYVFAEKDQDLRD